MRLSASVYESIKLAAKELRNTPFALLLAAYQTWLHRLSGQDDLVVGVPFAGQAGAGLEALVGQCVHTLPLRVKLDAREPFVSLLRKVRAGLLDAQENWNYSFGQLVQMLDLPRDSSRIPLVSVTFNLDRPMSRVQFAGCQRQITAAPRFYFQYDLGFNLVDEGSTLLIECDYNCSLFEAETIRHWLGHFQTLLEGIVADPTEQLGRLPLVKATELPTFRSELNVDDRAIAGAESVHGLIAAQAARTPEAIAVECDGQCSPYAELEGRANQLGNGLRNLGIGPGSLVVVCVERSFEMVVAILGVLKAGGAYVPIDPSLPRERVANIFADTKAAVLLTQGSLLALIPESTARLVCLDEDRALFAKESAAPPPDRVAPTDLAYVIYTSGSTGKPKGVEISHGAVVNFLLSMKQRPGLAANDVVLALTTLSFDIAVLELLLPLIVGARTVVVTREVLTDPKLLSTTCRRCGVTVMQATPITWRSLRDAGWQGDRNLKVLCGGEALGPDLADWLLSCCGELWNLYGPTETTVWSTVGQLKPGTPITLGRPIANTQLYLVDEQGQPVPIGVAGEMWIGGAGLARGFHNLPELTAQKFTPNPFSNDKSARVFRTGDLVRYRPDGGIEFVGRKDFQVKLRGFRIELGEIEAILLAHAQVRAAVALVREDEPSQPKLVVYYIPNPAVTNSSGGSASDFRSELRELIRSKLPDYMVPSAFVRLDALPCTPEGKLDRTALPRPSAECFAASASPIAPRTELEQKLARIWAEILKHDKVGVRDNFFDLGGQSLLAVSLFAKIERELGRKLPLATLFRAPTIEQLAAALNVGAAADKEWDCLVPIQPKGSNPPLFLVHGAGGNVLLYRSVAQHLAPDYPLYGLQSRGLDGRRAPLHTIEEMAAEYLKEIRAVQPKGPYHLGGYCLGGTVAYEMAQILQKDGEEVRLVAMLDTYNFAKALKSGFLSFIFERFRFHCGNFFQLRPRDMLQYLVEKARIARDGELSGMMTFRPGSSQTTGVARAESGIEASIQAINDHAADHYLPRPYQGRLTLFKPHINYKFYPDPRMGWGDLALGGLDIVELPVNPHAMLVEPYVQDLVAKLKEYLQGMQSSPVTRIRAAPLPSKPVAVALAQ